MLDVYYIGYVEDDASSIIFTGRVLRNARRSAIRREHWMHYSIPFLASVVSDRLRTVW
jgi:hypothetical protein